MKVVARVGDVLRDRVCEKSVHLHELASPENVIFKLSSKQGDEKSTQLMNAFMQRRYLSYAVCTEVERVGKSIVYLGNKKGSCIHLGYGKLISTQGLSSKCESFLFQTFGISDECVRLHTTWQSVWLIGSRLKYLTLIWDFRSPYNFLVLEFEATTGHCRFFENHGIPNYYIK